MTRKAAVLLLTVFVLAALPALAAPNFSGTWKLNASKSDFGQMPAPDSMVRTIKHEEPKLTVTTKQSSQMGEFENTAEYTTDGKECVNKGMRDMETKSTLKWEGETLVINSKMKFQDNDVTMNEKWSVDAAGKTMTIVRKFSSSMGEFETKIVMEKQ